MAVAEGQRVTIEEGVVFGSGGGRDLRCDVFTPPEQLRNGAGVLLVHGGAWARGDRSQLRGYGILLGRIGYTCVACEYRLSGEAKWPAQIHDVKAALRWMRANSGALGIDPAKIAISGNSAGGHLSLMAGGTQSDAKFEGDGGSRGAGTQLAAVIAFYAPAMIGVPSTMSAEEHRRILSQREPPTSEAAAFLLGDDRSEARMREASPLTYADRGFPPTQLFHGNKDAIVPYRSSFLMHEALAGAGVPVELHVYDGAPHAFDAISEYGRQCATIMALFLERHVVNPRPIAVPEAATTAPVRA